MSASRRRRRSGPVTLLPGLFGAPVFLAVAAAPLAAQPPGPPSGRAPTEPGVLEFTISDLDDDHLDFLTGWDRDDGDLLEAFSRGTARFRLLVALAPVSPELTASRWVWFAGAAAPARPPSEAVPRPRCRSAAGGTAGGLVGRSAGARPRSGSPPRARFPEPRPGARPFPAGTLRPPHPGTRAPSGPASSSGRAGAPGPRRPRPTASGAGGRPGGSSAGRAVPRRTGGPRRSR